jgi:large subunit ribosomal protein L10e
MGKKFYLKVEVYPHHVIRYHPTAGVAQADRYYQGMSKPFGRPDARAAILKENQEVLNVYINDENLSKAKEALRRAARKLPVPTKIVVE